MIGEPLPRDPDRWFGPFGGTWVATPEKRGLSVAYPGGNVWVVAGPGDAKVSYDEESVTIGDSDGPCEVAVVGVVGNLPVKRRFGFQRGVRPLRRVQLGLPA